MVKWFYCSWFCCCHL